MKIHWLGHKKDLNHCSHIWGIVALNGDSRFDDLTIMWGSANGNKIHMRRTYGDLSSQQALINNKKLCNYREITEQKFAITWPHLMEDIEMHLIVKKLSK